MILFVTGSVLIYLTQFYPFTLQGAWVTEKLIAVIIYIGLGHVVLGKRTQSQMVRSIAFMAAIFCLYFIIALAVNKIPLIIEYA